MSEVNKKIINDPFLPVEPDKRILLRLLTLLIGPFLIVIRLPFFCITLFFLFLYNKVVLCRYITLIVNLILCRLLLLNLGFFGFFSSFKLFTSIESSKIPKMNSGNIVLCSYSSPIDFLYLSYIMSPIFTRWVVNQKNNQILFLPFNVVDIFFSLLHNPRFICPNYYDDLAGNRKMKLLNLLRESNDNKLGPTVIFYEGCPTNGLAGVKIDKQLFDEIGTASKFHCRNIVLLKIRYRNGVFPIVNPRKTSFFNLVKIMANLKNEIGNFYLKYFILDVNHKNIAYNSYYGVPSTIIKSVNDFYNSDRNESEATWNDYLLYLDSLNN